MPYRSEGNRQEKAFVALEWLAVITPYIGFKKCLGEEDIYQGISSSYSCTLFFDELAILEDF